MISDQVICRKDHSMYLFSDPYASEWRSLAITGCAIVSRRKIDHFVMEHINSPTSNLQLDKDKRQKMLNGKQIFCIC